MTTTTAPAAYLTHLTDHCHASAPEDRPVTAGQVPTCGDCRDVFERGYCPGFNLYDVEVQWDDQTETIRVANDNESTAAHSARWTVSQHYGWPHRDVTAAAVTHVAANPAAAAWHAARA